jgi:hypothetical protein
LSEIGLNPLAKIGQLACELTFVSALRELRVLRVDRWAFGAHSPLKSKLRKGALRNTTAHRAVATTTEGHSISTVTLVATGLWPVIVAGNLFCATECQRPTGGKLLMGSRDTERRRQDVAHRRRLKNLVYLSWKVALPTT